MKFLHLYIQMRVVFVSVSYFIYLCGSFILLNVVKYVARELKQQNGTSQYKMHGWRGIN